MLKVTYIGFEEFSRKLNEVRLERAINKGFVLAGTLIQNSVKKETPVDTSTLQRNWKTKPGNLYYTISNITKYGKFVHWGTRYITANPFMDRGLEKVEEKSRMVVFSQLIKELNR